MSKKMPGMLQDPWRVNAPEVAPAALTQPVAVPVTSTEEISEDLQTEKHATIELKGYGGITVDGTNHATVAAARILEFFVKHRKELEPILTEYGVVVAQMPVQNLSGLKFYVQRGDGWLFAIPGAQTRDIGCLHLVQAMLRLQISPVFKKKLEEYSIRPYKH